ncbi:MAG: peptidoglycan-binding protein [Dehalococcoidia bacterium]
MPSRGSLLFLAAGGVVAAGAVGWLAGQQVQSPEEATLNAKPPPAGPVTVPVERRQLTATIVSRGTAAPADAHEVTLASADAAGGAALVTRAPEAGSTLAEGAVALEVSGRPVFALAGATPMYRSLGIGSEGADVSQLEAALARLGFDPGEVDGVYGADTQAAVQRLYSAAGYAPPEPPEAEVQALAAADEAALQAEQLLASALRQRDDASKPPSALARLQADAEVDRARSALNRARDDAARTAREGAASVTARRHDLATVVASLPDRTAAQRKVVVAKAGAVRAAKVGLDAAIAILPIEGDAASIGGREQAILQAEAAYDRAQDDLHEAEQDLANVPNKHADDVAKARAALEKATLAASEDNTASRDSVAAAERDLELAVARRNELIAPKDTGAAEAAVAAAQAAVGRARAERSRLAAKAAARLPADNVIFVPTLPATVEKVGARVGAPPTGSVMTVAAAGITVRSSIALADAQLVKAGDAVRLEAASLRLALDGTITKVADRAGTDGLDAQRVAIEILPAETPPALKDASLRVSITVAATSGPVVAVPLAAVRGAADGTSFVERLSATGSAERVQVELGLSAQGYAEVIGSRPPLNPGERVIVGGPNK